VPIAIEMEDYGPPEALRAVEREPYAPGPGEVVVRTAVAGVNRADLFIRSGEWPHAGSWPYVPGLEVAGRVDRVGEGVTRLRPGDRVFTMMQRLGGVHGARRGGYQETVLVPESTLAKLPEGFSETIAGDLGLPAVTAVEALRVLEARSGHRALVLGGSSAVGSIAIQLLKSAGCHVVATGTRPEKFELMRRSGADEVLSTKSGDWTERTGAIDRIIDLLGGPTFGPAVELLRPEGRLVFVGGTTGGDVSFSAWALMLPVTLTGYSSETLDRATLDRAIASLAALHASGAVAVHEIHRFPIAEAAAAHQAMESGRIGGRVVLVGA
jgi:NADPH:quinone reductase